MSSARVTGNAGAPVGVQTITEDADEINFVVTEHGIFVSGAGQYVPFSEIKSVEDRLEDKHTFSSIGIETDDGRRFDIVVDSTTGRLRDAYPMSRFLHQVRARTRQTLPAFRDAGVPTKS